MTRTTKEQFIDFAGDEPEEREVKADERCECGYPMPCGKKVPVQFCKAAAAPAELKESP